MEKAKNILILSIKNKIEKKLKELHLEPKITPAKFFEEHGSHKHRYFSPCQNQQGKIVAFYARCHNNLDAKQKFIREAKFLEQIEKKKAAVKKSIPAIIDWKKEDDFEWMMRTYIEGAPVGHSRRIITPPTDETVSKIAKLVIEISAMRPAAFQGLSLRKFNCHNYFLKEQYQEIAQNGIITPQASQKIIKKIKEAMPYLKKENRFLSQGDLNLGNIIIDKNKKTWIIDWELIGINNFAYDISYLWAHLWEAKQAARNKLINGYIKKINSRQLSLFKKFLPVVASYLALGGVKMKQHKESKTGSQKRKKFYQKLLNNCTEDFEKLIKT